MDHGVLDADLAREMVNLLGDELKRVREKLQKAEQRLSTPGSETSSSNIHREHFQAMAAENAMLQAENTELRAAIAALKSSDHSHVKQEDNSSLIMQYETSIVQIQHQLSEALSDKETAIAKLSLALEQSQKEARTLREKYSKIKVAKRECQEVIEELSAHLTHNTDALDQIRVENARLCKDSDPETFFANVKYRPVAEQPSWKSIKPYSINPANSGPKSAQTFCKSDGVVRFHEHELIWAPSGIALGVFIRPPYQFKPQSNTWEKTVRLFEAGQTKDVYYRNSQGWHYVGTYELTGDMFTLPFELTEDLDPMILQSAAKRAVISSNLVLPSQVRMAEDLYLKGVLKLEFFGIRCVGYNKELNAHLAAKEIQPPKCATQIPANGAPVTPKTGGKRKRGEDVVVPSLGKKDKKD
ncbi:hypothetical protein BV22DRAFT_1121917 [Leucogyrophana mollusca]|uniref:Uncharacterized protein n=1 Tax=Leucogyrophana mollusca TaxID=85980 RepID=A0ACB8BAI8_9AGAM|nr:hypothetical protein BV22DRAFT_1121917 [Leucogyrophana mollusca]